jgi:hypothetical protein
MQPLSSGQKSFIQQPPRIHGVILQKAQQLGHEIESTEAERFTDILVYMHETNGFYVSKNRNLSAHRLGNRNYHMPQQD